MTDRARTDPGLEVDFSEVAGKTYRCIDGCALCCLCQPELLPDEETAFMSSPERAEAVTRKHISPEVRGAALKLRGDHGACWFLGKDLRCRIYSSRPHFCRAFPISTFVGWRIQFNVNVSCRGVGLAGDDLEEMARGLLSYHGDQKATSELKAAKGVFAEFIRNTRDAGVAQSFNSVRESAGLLADELTDQVGLSRIMTFAENASAAQNSPANAIARLVRRTEPEADVTERALVDGTELFDLPDLSLLPVYVDRDLRWRIFRLVDKTIVGYKLSEDGGIDELCRVDPGEVELLPLAPGGRRALRDYVSLVNSRDCFLGHAAYLCDSENYDFNFAQVYLGAVATNAIDLWWRSSFLARLDGRGELGPQDIREGVVFFDMDLLDLPTIGAFI